MSFAGSHGWKEEAALRERLGVGVMPLRGRKGGSHGEGGLCEKLGTGSLSLGPSGETG